MAPNTLLRLRGIMIKLISHVPDFVHGFVREKGLTVNKWMAGVQPLNWAGRMSTETRNEGHLICDVIGLDS